MIRLHDVMEAGRGEMGDSLYVIINRALKPMESQFLPFTNFLEFSAKFKCRPPSSNPGSAPDNYSLI